MLTPEAVAQWLGMSAPDDHVNRCTAAVNAFVGALPSAPRTTAGEWSESTALAATMLAARLVRRRNSPAGVEAFTDTGAVYVSRYDADVALMLRMGDYAAPKVG